MEDRRRDRVVEIDRDALTPEQAGVLADLDKGRGWVPTPYKIWIHSPEAFRGMETIGTHLHHSSTLRPVDYEAVVLSSSVYWGSDYVVNNQTRHGLKAGLSQATVDAILARDKVKVDDPRLQAVFDLVADALAGGAVTDEAFDRYERDLGRTTIAEILVLIGYNAAVSIAMRMHDVKPAAR